MWNINVSKTFKNEAHSFSLNIDLQSDSKKLVILGPSGSGKSLMLKAIAGLLTPDSGKISLNNQYFFDKQQGINLSPQQRNLAYVFQDYALFPHLTVRQNIAFVLQKGWFNPSKKFHHDKVSHWLERFGLNQIAEQLPNEISGGQRQRTALARALVTDPQALLLDEPFSALDPDLRSRMRQELNELQRQLDIPLLLITHDLEDAKILQGELVHINNGEICTNEHSITL